MLANYLSGQKWEVAVVDANPDSFTGLDEAFSGHQVSGRITDEEALREAGTDTADLVVVLTSDDIANLMGAQLVRQRFGREKVLARVRDPIKAGAYRDLGLQTICPSEIELGMILKELGLKSEKT